MTIKAGSGIKRMEFEYSIPFEDSEAMLNDLCQDKKLVKSRHWVQNANHTWVVDCFDGKNRGLVLAEIELKNVEEAFERPGWVGKDVTSDRRFINSCLAVNPFKIEP